MLWAYFAFSQYLIIWSGNLPEEITLVHPPHVRWLGRAHHRDWRYSTSPRRFCSCCRAGSNAIRGKLVLVAVLMLVMRMVDLLWMLVPGVSGIACGFGWTWSALIGFGGLWLAFFTWQLGKRPLIPINDPQFESTLEQMHAGGH